MQAFFRDDTAPAISCEQIELASDRMLGEDELSCLKLLPLPELSVDFLRGHNLFPVAEGDDWISMVVAPPLPLALLDSIRQRVGKNIRVMLAPREGIAERLDALIGSVETSRVDDPDADRGGIAGDDTEHDLDTLKALAEDAPVVRLAQELLQEAIDAHASDLHLEIFRNEFRVRRRVDGVLLDRPSPPRTIYLPLISHLKLRAQMNIAERRLPQDGRIKLTREGRDIDLRISTVPTVHGESMAIRLLDQGPGLVGIGDLGLQESARTILEAAITLPHGMVLVTGPTGSGKTTSLYAVLGVLNHSGNKIITVEDPVEYQIDGVNQIQVKPLIDLNFSTALRSIVRQDPDILMVGEIRDRETAEIAIQSALTGHLVFSTLHTNDAAGAPHRLLDMGVEPYLIASSVVLIVAQRLVRTLCPHCKARHMITQADRLFLEQHGLITDQDDIAAAVGCARCGGSGYMGRVGIFEMLPVSDGIKEAILRKEPAAVLRRIAQREGNSTLHADGLQKVLDGLTTLEELARVARHDAQANDSQ